MNEKHKEFCDVYLANGKNGTQAYLDVYPSVKKEATAAASAARLLTNDKVKEYLQIEMAKSSAKLEITRESILEKLLRIQSNTESTNPSASLKALEMVSKLLGLNEPIKTDITTNGKEIAQEIKVNIIRPKTNE